MSEDERENGHNKKQKMKSVVQDEESKPNTLQELLAQMNANLLIPTKKRIPRFSPEKRKSPDRSTDLLPLRREIPSSVAVEGNQNMPQSSNVARASKKVATRKNKGIVIEEGAASRKGKRPDSLKIPEPLPKGSIVDSEYDLTSEDDSDKSDRNFNPDLEPEDDTEK